MALPAALTRLFSFTGFAQGLGNGTFAGTELDTDLDQTNNAVNDVVALLRLLVRADGKFANGSVTRNALAADVVLGLGASRPWSANTAYAKSDTVTRGYGLYVALVANSGSDPLSSTAWALQADLSQAVVIAPGSIVTDSYALKSVTEPKLDDGSATSRVIAGKAVTREKAATNLGVVPVGAELDFAGVALPVGWLFCSGQAVSRTTYADLFSALSLTFIADTTPGSPVLSNANRSISGFGLRGGVVEGPGIPAGTILSNDAAGSLALSTPATAGGTQVTIRVMPFGRGDGATTFNLPDRRGRVLAGRDDMSGAGAGRLTQPFDGANLASAGGVSQAILVNANLPVNLPGGAKVTVSYPAHTYTVNAAVTNIANGSGNIIQNVMLLPTEGKTAPPPAQDFNVSALQNVGGGQAFAVVQPTGVTNKIIFAGI